MKNLTLMNKRRNLLFILVILLILVAASAIFLLFVKSPSPAPQESGIIGKITYGPAAPVCRENEPCSKPYTGKVEVKTEDQSRKGTFFGVVLQT